MKSWSLAALVVAVGLCAAACGDDDTLHSGPVCPAGQDQVCEGDSEQLRCACVAPDAGSDGGADAG